MDNTNNSNPGNKSDIIESKTNNVNGKGNGVSKRGVEYRRNEDGSITFFPIKNERCSKELASTTFANSAYCPKTTMAVFDSSQRVVNKQSSKCSFIDCAEMAYSHHYPLVIKPEHIYLMIAQAISTHVEKNAEHLRAAFVYHKDGKKKLTVRLPAAQLDNMLNTNGAGGDTTEDWSEMISGFAKLIDANTKPDVAELFDCNFSSSTLTEKIAAKVTLMAVVESYFEYEMFGFLCGFPEITLAGTVDDWRLLRSKVERLLTQKMRKGFGELWSRSLLPVLDKFVAAFSGDDISMVFWNSMVFKGQWVDIPFSYGGPSSKEYHDFISGWINVFFPYTRNGYENQWCFKPYTGDKHADKQYGMHTKKELRSALGPSPGSFPEGFVHVPVKATFEGSDRVVDVQFTAGFMGFETIGDDLQLKPIIGWYIKEKKEEK